MTKNLTRAELLEIIHQGIANAWPAEDAAESVLDLLARHGLAIVEGFDTSEAPHAAVRDAVPLVLYFSTRSAADEMVAAVREWKPGMVAHEVAQ